MLFPIFYVGLIVLASFLFPYHSVCTASCLAYLPQIRLMHSFASTFFPVPLSAPLLYTFIPHVSQLLTSPNHLSLFLQSLIFFTFAVSSSCIVPYRISLYNTSILLLFLLYCIFFTFGVPLIVSSLILFLYHTSISSLLFQRVLTSQLSKGREAWNYKNEVTDSCKYHVREI